MTGTLINAASVLAGSAVGLAAGHRLPERLRETVMKGIGLMTLVIGAQMALKTGNVLIVLGGVLVGGVLGASLRLHDGLDAIGDALQRRFASAGDGRFSEAFVTSSLVFCVGPMTVMGAIQDGLTGDYHLLAVKATLDGFASLAFAASLGPGVVASTGTVLAFQGALTLFASQLRDALTSRMIEEMTAAGGVLILGIGFNLLRLDRIRVADFLPALAVAPGIVKAVEMMRG
ncbi:MAG: hypothetical protein A3F84_16975 [Candidatus Handelsmanbacteria bacterium RIFCSPLOWO2_12_FULL_64_10]|uniref:DUF554 domain-containing protein n=1 Tax=Handelsmanbacteria sp. (strain RIFCSPLOWO2_12_FULL_64_10) TaxID=1817868 RepID=A0A1F6C9S3_HANXR|nr:MAG: hypothetical protein A3F84_16975 [Candidatus Handelsmanbacteria bacterium RIFCSPLOWO2_12_FULL_64_10]